MAKKRKHVESEAATAAGAANDAEAPERPKRTLLGWKDKKAKEEDEGNELSHGGGGGFRNKEKVLITCSRRINFRYRHLMLNLSTMFPHCKKDNKVESKATKGATLNELVELRSCSSCLFFEVFDFAS